MFSWWIWSPAGQNYHKKSCCLKSIKFHRVNTKSSPCTKCPSIVLFCATIIMIIARCQLNMSVLDIFRQYIIILYYWSRCWHKCTSMPALCYHGYHSPQSSATYTIVCSHQLVPWTAYAIQILEPGEGQVNAIEAWLVYISATWA